MIHVLYHSDRGVKQALFDRVNASTGPMLIAAVRAPPGSSPVESRDPFATLEATLGSSLQQVLVADEGSVEGMWRDPVGDLADALYPHDKGLAYAGATGYLLLLRGRGVAVVKKQATLEDDAWSIHRALSEADPAILPPGTTARRRPARGTAPASATQASPAEDDATIPPPPGEPAVPSEQDPYEVLGIARGITMDEARRAFRSRIALYHPDKVSHLAPEFRALAEQRTRLMLEAWERLRSELKRST